MNRFLTVFIVKIMYSLIVYEYQALFAKLKVYGSIYLFGTRFRISRPAPSELRNYLQMPFPT